MTEKIIIEDIDKTGPSWPEQLLKGLNQMRACNTLCDVVINTQDDKYYSVHSAVIGASSTFFSQILSQSKSSGVGIIVKLEKHSRLVEAMVDYLYTGQASVDPADLQDFQAMMEGYGLTHIASLCCDKQYFLTFGNLVTNKDPQDETSHADEQPHDVLEYAEAVAVGVESVDPDLNAVEIEMEDIQKSLTVVNVAPEVPTRPRNPQPRTYNTGGPRKSWRDYKYTCNFCGKVFTSLSRMQGHQALHTGERLHECTICGQKFIQIEYLREHVSIHSNNKPFKCDTCQQAFRLQRHLRKHMQTHHSDKKFECESCGKMFKRQIGLEQHQRIHNGEKPFQCTICERFFRHKEALYRHKTAVHRENCPFRCGFCNVGFRHLNGLKDHQKFCTEAAKQKDLMCEYCKKIFLTKHTLNRHIQTKHPGKPSNYKKVDEEEVQKAALRSPEVRTEEKSGDIGGSEEMLLCQDSQDGVVEHRLVLDQSEVILQSLENGIILQDGNNLKIQTEEDGHTVYQVLTFEMGDDVITQS